MTEKRSKAKERSGHPLDDLLRKDRIPHIWCPGCGIGTAFSSCLKAIRSSGVEPKNVVMVSGIGCSGRAAGYVNLDSFHTTHGRAIPFATGLKLANPVLHVIVFSGDGDLFAIGGNHLIHAARRNVDMTVICVNNFNYGMTGGQVAATTPKAPGRRRLLWKSRDTFQPASHRLCVRCHLCCQMDDTPHPRDRQIGGRSPAQKRVFIHRGAFPLPGQLRPTEQGIIPGNIKNISGQNHYQKRRASIKRGHRSRKRYYFG